jgi:hypothetical protein
VRGRVIALAATLAIAVAFPAASSPAAAVHFKVVSAKATATLTFHTESADQTTLADGKITLLAAPKKKGTGSLGAHSGRVLFPIKGSVAERVKTKRLDSSTSEYQEQSCVNTRKLGGRGGLTLIRTGSRVEARWAFPQAKESFCRGPAVGKSITAKMKTVVPASRFQARSFVLVLAGTGNDDSTGKTLTYRWRATLKLARS